MLKCTNGMNTAKLGAVETSVLAARSTLTLVVWFVLNNNNGAKWCGRPSNHTQRHNNSRPPVDHHGSPPSIFQSEEQVRAGIPSLGVSRTAISPA